MQEVVVARGMNDSQFQANPLVTLQHAYNMPPAGRSPWRKRVNDGDLIGIKAKTQYPAKPDAWVEGDPWPPDKVYRSSRPGCSTGSRSVFSRSKYTRRMQRQGKNAISLKINSVVEKWLLLEYVVCFLPANQDALVESVSKSGLELPDDFLKAIGVVPTLISRRISPQRTRRTRRKGNAENDGPCVFFLRALRVLCGEIIRRRRRPQSRGRRPARPRHRLRPGKRHGRLDDWPRRRHQWGWTLTSTGSFASIAGENNGGPGEVFAVLADASLWQYTGIWAQLDAGVLAAAAPRRG